MVGVLRVDIQIREITTHLLLICLFLYILHEQRRANILGRAVDLISIVLILDEALLIYCIEVLPKL